MQLSENGAAALATDEGPYAREFMSGRQYRDVYSVDVTTGKRTKILTKSLYGATLSPSGRYAAYQQDGQWSVLDLKSGARTNLTGKIKSGFVNTEDDHPVPERRAYGLAGFTTGEKSVLVNDRFDLWQVAIDGSSATRLTRGREDSTVYRCVNEGGGGGGGGGREGEAAAVRGRRRASSTAKAERSTRRSRSCCRPPASTTRRADTRGSRSASRRSSSSGSTRA